MLLRPIASDASAIRRAEHVVAFTAVEFPFVREEDHDALKPGR
jgi:hypothetical protein